MVYIILDSEGKPVYKTVFTYQTVAEQFAISYRGWEVVPFRLDDHPLKDEDSE